MGFCGWSFWQFCTAAVRPARLFLPRLSQFCCSSPSASLIPCGSCWLDLAGVLRLWTIWTWQTRKAVSIPFSLNWIMEQNRSCPCFDFSCDVCDKRSRSWMMDGWMGGWNVHAGGQPYQAKPSRSPDEMAGPTKVTRATTDEKVRRKKV
ncbi:hypothetical protein BDP81DRAFT_438775 [Colletotrichum phormii]|uniref:Secreted protein n=1 Tax=Colletotrichum phormii TaxID=359342 RepID=A0AAJ0EAB7_9PEZI|nr:uncharacterized protein BDP81DRAFT_438775 [Colletotrichum phormii]KAK1623745.1 hypothetical protein BDP81DRAFT_438775 [Colletotrichum phormii]